jgi:hypothetical protein
LTAETLRKNRHRFPDQPAVNAEQIDAGGRDVLRHQRVFSLHVTDDDPDESRQGQNNAGPADPLWPNARREHQAGPHGAYRREPTQDLLQHAFP